MKGFCKPLAATRMGPRDIYFRLLKILLVTCKTELFYIFYVTCQLNEHAACSTTSYAV